MEKKLVSINAVQHQKPPVVSAYLSDEELMELYLAMPPGQRDKMFADTARAAEITGLTQRTIQFWIETGAIQAVAVGRKYRVSLESLTGYLKRRKEKPTS